VFDIISLHGSWPLISKTLSRALDSTAAGQQVAHVDGSGRVPHGPHGEIPRMIELESESIERRYVQ
jgi:hypothetical protein